MNKYIFLISFILYGTNVFASQQSIINDIAQKQADIVIQNGWITYDNTQINGANADIVVRQSNIVTDNSAIATDNQNIAQYNANNAQTASGVNWDYFVTLEPQVPFAVWSKVNSGINWTSIVPTLGINCGGITEVNVNWNNWGKCETNGMTPGTSFGGFATGIAAFWCGNGSIAGTC